MGRPSIHAPGLGRGDGAEGEAFSSLVPPSFMRTDTIPLPGRATAAPAHTLARRGAETSGAATCLIATSWTPRGGWAGEAAAQRGESGRATRLLAGGSSSTQTSLNVMKEGLFGATLRRVTKGASDWRPIHMMLHAGLDFSCRRLDCCLLDRRGERVEVGVASAGGDGLAGLARRVGERYGPVALSAAVESMNGARFVYDTLECCGWRVEVADA